MQCNIWCDYKSFRFTKPYTNKQTKAKRKCALTDLSRANRQTNKEKHWTKCWTFLEFHLIFYFEYEFIFLFLSSLLDFITLLFQLLKNHIASLSWMPHFILYQKWSYFTRKMKQTKDNMRKYIEFMIKLFIEIMKKKHIYKICREYHTFNHKIHLLFYLVNHLLWPFSYRQNKNKSLAKKRVHMIHTHTHTHSLDHKKCFELFWFDNNFDVITINPLWINVN